MSVRIVFLGSLRDVFGAAECKVPAPLDWTGLLEAVGEPVAARVRNAQVHVACAGKVIADKTALSARDGDEVALLPPVSGG